MKTKIIIVSLFALSGLNSLCHGSVYTAFSALPFCEQMSSDQSENLSRTTSDSSTFVRSRSIELFLANQMIQEKNTLSYPAQRQIVKDTKRLFRDYKKCLKNARKDSNISLSLF